MQKLAGCLRLPGGAARVLPESVLATAATPQPSACHCEPVRTLAWQSASPQKCLASWQLFGQIRYALRICPKYCFLFCATARRTDCHVASLLAMTMGGRPCTRRHAPAFRTPCAPNILAPAHTSFLLHVIANQCAHWCGNPRPRRETRQVGATSGKSAAPLVFARSTTFCHVLPQGVRIATSLRSSQ